MKKLLVLFLLIGFSACLFAQLHPDHKRANNWIFGCDDNGAIWYNFNYPFTNTIANPAVCCALGYAHSTISDTAGNLMFHISDGPLLNRNFQIVDYLEAYNCGMYGSLFLPVPGNDSLILVFHSGCFTEGFSGLRYSLLNAKANNGLGSIVFKNTMLLPRASGSVAAACHNNGKDYWLVSADTSSNMYSWLIDSTGVPQLRDSKQVISTKTLFGTPIARIVMAFTPRFEADILGIVSDDFENGLVTDYTVSLMKFDNEAGTFGEELLIESHAGIVQSGDFFSAQLSFSPSGKWLYIPFVETTVPRDGYIKRYTNLYDAQTINDVYSEIVYSSNVKSSPYTIQCTPYGNMVFYRINENTPATPKTTFTSYILYPDSAQPVLLLDAVSTGSASTNTTTLAPLNNLPWQWYYRPEGYVNIPVNLNIPLLVAPNPVNDVLYILNIEQEIKSVIIFDITGRIYNPLFKPMGEIYTSNLNNGIYLLKIEFRNGLYKTAKIVVQH